MPLDLPRGLALNAFQVACPGTHTMRRLRVAYGSDRRSLEARLGQSVFMRESFAYTSASAEVTEAEDYEFSCETEPELHLRDIRNALAEHAINSGLDASFAFGGVIHIVGFDDLAVIDGIRVQPRLRMRVESSSSLLEAVPFIVARADTRWVVAGSLAQPDAARNAVGERVVRLRGTGPDRGQLVANHGGRAELLFHGQQVTGNPADYTVAANSRFVRQHYGSETLRRLQVASGSLSSSGNRNRYAVKDRFRALAVLMDAFGWSFRVGDAEASIEAAWTEIRVQDAADAT